MSEAEIERRLREQFNLRIGPETARYIAARLAAPSAPPAPFPIIARDARTGHPVRETLDPAHLPTPQSPG
jgi:hypothetical protein